MSKSFKQVLIDIVGRDLENKGFELASMKCHQGYPIYHRKSNRYIEIIQFGKDRNEPKLIISCSIVYFGVDEEKSNIHYPSFREFSNGDLTKICVDDCREKYFVKGHIGNNFFFGDVYLALGRGIVGVEHDSHSKPLGFKIKRYTDSTYFDLCNLIIKRMNFVYSWLDKQKQST